MAVQLGSGLLIVDGNYFFHVQAVTHIDLEKLVKKLEACVGTSFVDKYWFDSRPHEKDKMNRLGWIYPDFTNKRHTVHTKCPKCQFSFEWSSTVQAGVDVGIAVTLLDCGAYNRDIQEIVLVAGDGDFYTAVEKAKIKYDKHIWVVCSNDSRSTRLTALAGARALIIEDIMAEDIRPTSVSPTIASPPPTNSTNEALHAIMSRLLLSGPPTAAPTPPNQPPAPDAPV